MINWNTKPIAPPSARRLAYDVLYDVFVKEAYANLTLQKVMKKYSGKKYEPLSKPEKGLLTELVYGVCRRYNHLTWIMSRLSTRPVRKMDPKVRILLAIGLYQLVFLDRIPESAAVNETVEIAKKVTHLGNVKFINAILRSYLRKKIQLHLPQRKGHELQYLSLTLNEPEWLIRRMSAQIGKARTEAVLEEFNKAPALDIHANPIKLPSSKLFERLKFHHAEPELIPFIPDGNGIRVGNGDAFFRSPLLKNGEAYVQSAASMIPAVVMNPSRGDKVLDMCAAPGSKSINIAQLTGNWASIDAWDLYEHKVNLIDHNARTLGIRCIHAEQHDSTVIDESRKGQYDKVLLDAPCSGLGVLGHKPEIRWRRTEDNLKEFPPLQQKLLDAASVYVKPGGVLVYSTCTLNREENEDMIAWFLEKHKDFRRDTFDFAGRHLVEGMITIWPDEFHTDGFFVARLVRRSNDD